MTIDRRAFLEKSSLGLLALTCPGAWLSACGGGSSRSPSFVFFLIDDLGWVDTEPYGSSFHDTPHLRRLASEGMLFTDAYTASPVCSPTRASILTGKHPARLNITDWIGGRQAGMLLPAEYERQMPLGEVTLAEALKEAGYATGYFGKWHLGNDATFFPEHQGFDVNVGGHGAGQPASYFYPYRAAEGRNPYWDVPGLEDGVEGEYLTDRLTDEALEFLDAHADEPFLLYLSHYAVHTPIQSKEALAEKYRVRSEATGLAGATPFEDEKERARTRLRQDNPAYAGMVESVDESVGRVLDRLDALGLAESTVVIFMSDNGGLSTLAGERMGPTSNEPLRAGKGWLYEGGIRSPLIVRWPGVTAPGSVCAEPVTSTDFYPTMLEMAGLPLRPGQHADGESLVPLLGGAPTLERDALFWHFPHYHGSGNRPSGAIRVGDHKLVEWFEDGSVELYDLSLDPGESLDLIGEQPERARELRSRLEAWRQEVDARMPRPNPDRSHGG